MDSCKNATAGSYCSSDKLKIAVCKYGCNPSPTGGTCVIFSETDKSIKVGQTSNNTSTSTKVAVKTCDGKPEGTKECNDSGGYNYCSGGSWYRSSCPSNTTCSGGTCSIPTGCLCTGGKYVGAGCGHASGLACDSIKKACDNTTCATNCAKTSNTTGSCSSGTCICASSGKANGETCSSGSECSSGNCGSASVHLNTGTTPLEQSGALGFNLTQGKECIPSQAQQNADTAQAVKITAITAGVGITAVIGAVAVPSIVGLAAANGGIAALPNATAVYLSTLPAGIQTTAAVTGSVLGYFGVITGTTACTINPYSAACSSYIGAIQGNPAAMIELAKSTDSLIAAGDASLLKSYQTYRSTSTTVNEITDESQMLENGNVIDMAVDSNGNYYYPKTSISESEVSAVNTSSTTVEGTTLIPPEQQYIGDLQTATSKSSGAVSEVVADLPTTTTIGTTGIETNSISNTSTAISTEIANAQKSYEIISTTATSNVSTEITSVPVGQTSIVPVTTTDDAIAVGNNSVKDILTTAFKKVLTSSLVSGGVQGLYESVATKITPLFESTSGETALEITPVTSTVNKTVSVTTTTETTPLQKAVNIVKNVLSNSELEGGNNIVSSSTLQNTADYLQKNYPEQVVSAQNLYESVATKVTDSVSNVKNGINQAIKSYDQVVTEPLDEDLFGEASTETITTSQLSDVEPTKVESVATTEKVEVPTETKTTKVTYSKELDPLINIKKVYGEYGQRLSLDVKNGDWDDMIAIARENGYEPKYVPLGDDINVISDTGGKITEPLRYNNPVRVGSDGKTLYIALNPNNNTTIYASTEDLSHDLGAIIMGGKTASAINEVYITPENFADFLTKSTGKNFTPEAVAEEFGTTIIDGKEYVPDTWIMDKFVNGELTINILDGVPSKPTTLFQQIIKSGDGTLFPWAKKAAQQVSSLLDQGVVEPLNKIIPGGKTSVVSTTEVVSSNVKTTSSLISERSTQLTDQINSDFGELSSEEIVGGHINGYLTEGEINNYNYQNLSAIDIVKGSVADKTSLQPIKILDIGAAKGGFLKNIQQTFGNKVELYGLSANDYRTPNNLLTGINYKIGNAENLSSIYPSNSFDIITSKVTVGHFDDPLGAIQQMYDSLKSGGILAVDGFNLPGLEGRV